MNREERPLASSAIESVRNRGVTVVLVTHFMEEAERLCDRLAVIDAGRVVAIDTPAGLVARVDNRQRVRFRPSAQLDPAVLTALPEVASVERAGSQLVVTGTGNLLLAVALVAAREQIVPPDLRVRQTPPGDAVGHVEHQGQTYYFCADSCLEQFRSDPERFLTPGPANAGGSNPAKAGLHAIDQ